MLDRLKSICVAAKKPTVRTASWTSVATAPMRELPFEAEPDVGHDPGDGEEHRERARPRQFARHARPDHLDPAIVVVGRAERAAHLLDDLLLRRFAARLRRDRG